MNTVKFGRLSASWPRSRKRPPCLPIACVLGAPILTSDYGQLHVRTAFPTTGGFDEQVTLICLHPALSSSRIFARFLPLIAAVRSVYAPDLPGCGESDPSSDSGAAAAAAAVSDLVNDLRLRQIDFSACTAAPTPPWRLRFAA